MKHIHKYIHLYTIHMSYLLIHIYTQAYIHTLIHTYIYAHINADIDTHTVTGKHIPITLTYTQIGIYTYTHMQ